MLIWNCSILESSEFPSIPNLQISDTVLSYFLYDTEILMILIVYLLCPSATLLCRQTAPVCCREWCSWFLNWTILWSSVRDWTVSNCLLFMSDAEHWHLINIFPDGFLIVKNIYHPQNNHSDPARNPNAFKFCFTVLQSFNVSHYQFGPVVWSHSCVVCLVRVFNQRPVHLCKCMRLASN